MSTPPISAVNDTLNSEDYSISSDGIVTFSISKLLANDSGDGLKFLFANNENVVVNTDQTISIQIPEAILQNGGEFSFDYTIRNTPLLGETYNIAYVVDTSGSTYDPAFLKLNEVDAYVSANAAKFNQYISTYPANWNSLLQGYTNGTINTVDILNTVATKMGLVQFAPSADHVPAGYNFKDTILDLEKMALTNLSNAFINAGIGSDDQVALIPFSTDSSITYNGSMVDSDGFSGLLESKINSLSSSGGTNYEASLKQAINFFTSVSNPGEINVLYFLSDGFYQPSNNDPKDPLGTKILNPLVSTLKNSFGTDLNVVGVGSGVNLDQLKILANDAKVVLDPADLTAEIESLLPNAATSTAKATIKFPAPNAGPTAQDDSILTSEDQSITTPGIFFTSNDTDPNNDQISITHVSLDSDYGGKVTLNNDGNIQYTPAENFTGQDKFTYTISDGKGGTSTATVNVIVNPINDAPVTTDDAFVVNEDLQLLVNKENGLLINDSDLDGDNLFANLVTGPNHGTLSLNPDGSLAYTPHANFHGEDTFTYKVNDGTTDSNTASVKITVNPVNDTPMANNDLFNGMKGQAINISFESLLSNDSDPDSDPLSLINFTNTKYGELKLNASGDGLVYTANATGGIQDGFEYTISDGKGGTSTALVDINIQKPALPGTFVVNESGKVSIDFLSDHGSYKSQIGIFSLNGMEDLEPGSKEFIQEAIRRITSDTTEGRIVLDDRAEGAKYNSTMGEKSFNSGTYQGQKFFDFEAGDTVAIIALPDGKFSDLMKNSYYCGKKLPLFSIEAANPKDFAHIIKLPTDEEHNLFGFEDLRTDGKSDRDFNDIVFEMDGLEMVGSITNPNAKTPWTNSEIYHKIVEDLDNDLYKDFFNPHINDTSGDDILKLNNMKLKQISLEALDTNSDGGFDSLLIEHHISGKSILIENYFDNSANDLGAGNGLIEMIDLKGADLDFNQVINHLTVPL